MRLEFDLTPNPRVLQMLGEINLQQWRCLAELLDNSIDGFMHAARSGERIEQPEIAISMPTSDNENARLTVKDNGPGMSFETLENAVKAGWSGNEPLGNLGLFGMGFNIATARLGSVTEVWTSRAGDPEEVGVRIDLGELRASNNFRVPRQTRPKGDHNRHGTEVVITRLKPDQRAYLARGPNQKNMRKHLARAYSALLGDSAAGRIRVSINGAKLVPRHHCVWNAERVVTYPDGSVARAVEIVDVNLAPRRYCTHCMRTLASNEETCPTGSSECAIVESPRRIHGWIGLQRYLHNTDFGFDFVRNGRKIEISNKDLFEWTEGETVEVEYPTDDQRGRGRFVGEIHLDHCRVSYTKDRFERDDPAWGEMIRIVRGEGPLRPLVAKQRGHAANDSPLYRLYQAFRRSSPQGKNGLWSRVLVVRNNESAQAMAESFAEGDPDYLGDERWWELVVQQDKEILGDGGEPQDPNLPKDFLDPGAQTPGEQQPTTPQAPPPPPQRRHLHDLSRRYVHPTFRVEFEVQALAVIATDPELPSGLPWLLRLDDVATRTYVFLVDDRHEVFRSTTMTPLDGLLIDLAHRTLEFLKGQAQDVSLARILADFRGQYCVEARLDPGEIISLASSALTEIARAVPNLMEQSGGEALYAELSDEERQSIARRMANRGVPDHKALIVDGRFWEYADADSIRRLFLRHPGLFLDGRFWDDDHARIDYGSAAVTDEARRAIVARYDGYFQDAVWLVNQSPADLDRSSRDAIVRATCSVRLLRPDLAE